MAFPGALNVNRRGLNFCSLAFQWGAGKELSGVGGERQRHPFLFLPLLQYFFPPPVESFEKYPPKK
jgi:hypothetical protein